MNQQLKAIDEAVKEFHRTTFFPANYIRCNLRTFSKMSNLFENGIVPEYGLKLLIDESIVDDEFHIGMGACPTFSKSKI